MKFPLRLREKYDMIQSGKDVRHTESVKGIVESTISLDKSSCYFMKSGKCALSIIGDFSFSRLRLDPSDVLYCPNLFRQMTGKDKSKPVNIIPCECGHAEVVSGQQRACIASQKRLRVAVAAAGEESYPLCSVCGSQMTLDETAAQAGGLRVVTVHAVIEPPKKPRKK